MPHSHLHVEEIGARSVLVAQDGPPPTSYTLNPYIGCGLRCTCCYVTKFPHARAKLWGRSVFVDSAPIPRLAPVINASFPDKSNSFSESIFVSLGKQSRKLRFSNNKILVDPVI